MAGLGGHGRARPEEQWAAAAGHPGAPVGGDPPPPEAVERRARLPHVGRRPRPRRALSRRLAGAAGRGRGVTPALPGGVAGRLLVQLVLQVPRLLGASPRGPLLGAARRAACARTLVLLALGLHGAQLLGRGLVG